jgi:radical SAM-linked protein
MLSVVRIRFERNESVKFTSHLETMKVFQRAVRRTGLKPRYSQGFNPQMQMIFGLPMQVGMTSTGEYADMEFDEEYKPSEISGALKRSLPGGFIITGEGKRNISRNIMADISYALYRITFNADSRGIAGYINSAEEIMAEKKSKHTVSRVDIKPYILEAIEIERETLQFLVRAGQVNLNTNTLVNAIKENYCGSAEAINTHRVELYVERDGKPCSPLSEKALCQEK